MDNHQRLSQLERILTFAVCVYVQVCLKIYQERQKVGQRCSFNNGKKYKREEKATGEDTIKNKKNLSATRQSKLRL